MKKLLYIFALPTALCSYAEQQVTLQYDEDCPGKFETSPYYYCECRRASTSFQFPLETVVADTMWFSASVSDMRQGLSAYWFSDDTITFEIYAFCSSKAPSVKLSVRPNRMHEMDVTDINRRLEEMGEAAEALTQVLNPRVRVYTEHGRAGKVYCYPYNQGPLSECDSLLPVFPQMTYVNNRPEAVYELKPEKMSPRGAGFIRWKQKDNMPGTIRLTTDSCNGPEIGSAVLSDSMRVYILDSAAIQTAKNAGKSVFVQVTHDSSYVGRIQYSDALYWTTQTIDTVICQGKALELPDTTLSESTVYDNDTLWLHGDTLALTAYNLTIAEPEAKYDTLRLKASQLPYNYRNQLIPAEGWGDYDLMIRQTGRCDAHYLLHVLHDTVRMETVIHDTLCLGKSVTYGGVTYTTDTIIRDSVWVDADTWAVRDITIHFTEPEPEYDTIYVKPSDMTFRGYWYGALATMVMYGDTVIVKTKRNACTRVVYLTVLEDKTTRIEAAPYGRQTYKYMEDGHLYIRREENTYDIYGRTINRK